MVRFMNSWGIPCSKFH